MIYKNKQEAIKAAMHDATELLTNGYRVELVQSSNPLQLVSSFAGNDEWSTSYQYNDLEKGDLCKVSDHSLVDAPAYAQVRLFTGEYTTFGDQPLFTSFAGLKPDSVSVPWKYYAKTGYNILKDK